MHRPLFAFFTALALGMLALGCECAPLPVASHCNFDSDCHDRATPRCAQGRCWPDCQTAVDCMPGYECVYLQGGAACLTPSELECSTSRPCATEGWSCFDGRCALACTRPSDCCAEGESCDALCVLGEDGRASCRRPEVAADGGIDGGTLDGGTIDGGEEDAGPTDSGPRDAGRDAGRPDGGGDCHGPGCDPVIDIAVGTAHACAVTDSGAVWCWGSDNGSASTGTGTPHDGGCIDDYCTAIPTRITLSSEVAAERAVEVEVSDAFTCVRLASGRVQCWGLSAGNGVLGSPIVTPLSAPIYVEVLADRSYLTGVVELSLGRQHGLVRREDGSVWGWGVARDGELGAPREANVPGARPLGWTGASTVQGVFGASCAVIGGVVECRGDNSTLSLGRTLMSGTFTTDAAPIDLAVTSFDQLAGGAKHFCGHTVAGAAYCWGAFTDPSLPRQIVIASGDTFHSVAAGTGASSLACGIAGTDRHVRCWGRADSSAFYPAGTDWSRPVAMHRATIHDVAELAVDGGTACVRTDYGDVLCWGDDSLGQLGRGTPESAAEPALVVWPE